MSGLRHVWAAAAYVLGQDGPGGTGAKPFRGGGGVASPSSAPATLLQQDDALTLVWSWPTS